MKRPTIDLQIVTATELLDRFLNYIDRLKILTSTSINASHSQTFKKWNNRDKVFVFINIKFYIFTALSQCLVKSN